MVVALLAQATEGAHVVDALSVAADLPGQGGALIDICRESRVGCGGGGGVSITVTGGSADPSSWPSSPLTHAVVVVGQLKAREAEAVVGAHRVLARAVPTGLAVTLVNVCQAYEEKAA